VLWGTEAHLADLFAGASAIRHTTRTFAFRYRSAGHFVAVFEEFYGPVHKAFGALDEDGRNGLERDLLALLRRFDRGDGNGLVVDSEYLETVITKP
jgi:hypothetical protein